MEKGYTGFGEPAKASNPYRVESGAPSGNPCNLSGTPAAWTYTFYDELGRVVQQVAAGATTTSLHEPGQVTITDPAGKRVLQIQDGLGRLKEVKEDLGGAADSTYYVYDAADRLTSVIQGTQTRSFSYDWAGQLLSAANPENGTTQYQYDDEGNFVAKKDARGAVVCAGEWNGTTCDGSGVDGLGRTAKKKYITPAGVGATQEVVYCFDGRKPTRLTSPDRVECTGSVVASERGLLTGVGNLASRTEYEHDLAGRMTKAKQITEGSTPTDATHDVEYQYYASDRLRETKLPSGKRVVECIDSRLRLIWASAAKTVADCSAGVTVASSDAYVTDAEYAPHGALAKWTLGNGLVEVTSYNSRLQPTQKRIGTDGNPGLGYATSTDDLLCLGWNYGLDAANNGNVRETTLWAKKTAGGVLGLKTLYSYDGRNRVEFANELVVQGGTNGGAWTQSNGYDRYGNRWATTAGIAQSDWTPRDSTYVDASTNRLTKAIFGGGTSAITYDAAGYMTGHPQVSGGLVYDAEGRLVSAGTATYTYDGEGHRVKKVAAGVTTWFWYGGDSGLVAEDTTESQPGGVQYLSVDALGSTRLVTNGDRSVVTRMDYGAFGDEILASASAGNRDLVSGYVGVGNVKQRFTGKERDTETGLDYFLARYVSAGQGRFTSPDEFTGGPVDPLNGRQISQPGPLPYADISDPQTLNKFVYVRNNPLRFVDPNGHCFWDACVVEAVVTATVATAVTGALIYSAQQLGTAIGDYINSKREEQSVQGRDEKGKFLPVNSGDARPGADREKKGLDAVGADKNTKPIPGSNRIPDGKKEDQYVEVKSGGAVSGTKQLNEMAAAAAAATGKPLVLVVDPKAKVSRPVRSNENIEVVKKPLN